MTRSYAATAKPSERLRMLTANIAVSVRVELDCIEADHREGKITAAMRKASEEAIASLARLLVMDLRLDEHAKVSFFRNCGLTDNGWYRT